MTVFISTLSCHGAADVEMFIPTTSSPSMGRDTDTCQWPMLGCWWASVWPVFVVFEPAAVLIGARDSSDWLFSLENRCTRRETKVMKANKLHSQEGTRGILFLYTSNISIFS